MEHLHQQGLRLTWASAVRNSEYLQAKSEARLRHVPDPKVAAFDTTNMREHHHPSLIGCHERGQSWGWPTVAALGCTAAAVSVAIVAAELTMSR